MYFYLYFSEGEGHVSSDEEDLADDADATDARKRARQADEDYEEGLSDEEMDLVKNIAKEFDDDQILDGEQSGLTTRTPSPTLATKYVFPILKPKTEVVILFIWLINEVV